MALVHVPKRLPSLMLLNAACLNQTWQIVFTSVTFYDLHLLPFIFLFFFLSSFFTCTVVLIYYELHYCLKRPQHLDGLGEANVIKVEVDESCKAEDADGVPHVLNPGDKLHKVVCQNAFHAPASINTSESTHKPDEMSVSRNKTIKGGWNSVIKNKAERAQLMNYAPNGFPLEKSFTPKKSWRNNRWNLQHEMPMIGKNSNNQALQVYTFLLLTHF